MSVTFAMLLIVGQLATRHSPLMFARVFTTSTTAYLILFLIMAILPLATQTVSDELPLIKMILVKLNFFLFFLSLVLFIPFLFYLRDRVNALSLLRELATRIQKKVVGLTKIPKETEEFIVQEISVIQSVILNAIRTGDYVTSGRGVKILADLAISEDININEYGKMVCLRDYIRSRILEIGLIAIPDQIASVEIVKALRSAKKSEELRTSISVLRKMVAEVVKNGSERTTSQIAYDLGHLGNVSIDLLKEREITESISGLRDLFHELLKIRTDWEEVIKNTVEALSFLGVKASEKIMSISDKSAKGLLTGKVRRVVQELRYIWDQTTKAGLSKTAAIAAYRIVTVSYVAIRVGTKSEIWPQAAAKLGINSTSKIASENFKQENCKDAALGGCRALQKLGMEASNSSSLGEIVKLVAQRLVQIRNEIEEMDEDQEIVDEIDYLINGICRQWKKLGLGDIFLPADQELDSYNAWNIDD